MKKKTVLCVMIAAAILAALLIVGCGGDKKPESVGRTPQIIRDAVRNAPEDVIIGIGIARTESDGESILLAEDRARAEISRQLDTKIIDVILEDQSEVTYAISSTRFITSKVMIRYKDNDGIWWCLIELLKMNADLDAVNLQTQDDITATLPVIMSSNMVNWPDIKNAVTLNDIPGWVFEAGPEDFICSVGAAKLDNDGEAVLLAMERARRSLARSISAEINGSVSDYISASDRSQSHQEEGDSITSVYEYIPIQMILLNQAKTKDGTFWVMLGYPKGI